MTLKLVRLIWEVRHGTENVPVVRFSPIRYKYETPMRSDVPRCSPMWSDAVIRPTAWTVNV